MNYTFIVALILVMLLLTLPIILITRYYLKCKPILCSSTQYTNTPVGLCLWQCDQYCDKGYTSCKPNDDCCIRECYAQKAECYRKCLGNVANNDADGGCGCKV